MNTITYLLFAITLNASNGEEIERHRVEQTPAYEQLSDCSAAQAANAPQRPKDGKITVYSCVALQGDMES